MISHADNASEHTSGDLINNEECNLSDGKTADVCTSNGIPDETVTVAKDTPEAENVEDSYLENDDHNKLFVGGLSHETTQFEFHEYFEKFGKVKSCILKVDGVTGLPRGFGFVVFEEESSIGNVLSVESHNLNGKVIDPKRAKPAIEPIKKIFVGGLSPTISEDLLKKYFLQFGKIESIDLPFDSMKNQRKSYIFVQYATEAEAKSACVESKHDIHGSLCDVRLANPRDQKTTQNYRGNNNYRQNYYHSYDDGSYYYNDQQQGYDYNYYGGYEQYNAPYYGSYGDTNNYYHNNNYRRPFRGGNAFRGGNQRSRGFHPYGRR